MPSVLLREQKERLISRIKTERAYIQPDAVMALAVIEILELLETKINEKAQD